MPGLAPGIHELSTLRGPKVVDARGERGHNGGLALVPYCRGREA
jgi:hypothetical protein